MIKIRIAGFMWPLSFVWRFLVAKYKAWAAREADIAEWEADRAKASPVKTDSPSTVAKTTHHNAQGKVGQSKSPLL